MEFGRVDPAELATIDFTLPPDPQQTIDTLKASAGTDRFELRIGATKWGRKEWLGSFYPAKIKESRFLEEYAKHFDSIFLQATFYQVYGPEQTLKWKELTAGNPNFMFFPLFPQNISHIRRLRNAEGLTAQFIEGVKAFGEKSGPAQLQLGDNFSPKSFAELKAYVEVFPKDFEWFIELRNKEWYKPEWMSQLDELLSKHKVGFAVTDGAGRRDCVHMHLTTPKALIRFAATGDEPTDHKRLDEWADRMKQWKSKGLLSAGFFITGPEERLTPQLCQYFNSKF